MVYALYAVSVVVGILFPILIAIWLSRRFGAPWRLFLFGAATFIISQIGHIPFNLAIQQGLGLFTGDPLWATAIFLGLSAGLFEECCRWVAYRTVAKDARSWSRGMMLGAGHGGVEATIILVLAIVNVVVLGLMQAGIIPLPELPEDQLALLQEQFAAVFDGEWYFPLLAGIERIFAVLLHLSLSLMVMQCFTRRQWWWLPLAIGFHTLANAAAVMIVSEYGALAAEAAIGTVALIAVGIIVMLRDGGETPDPA